MRTRTPNGQYYRKVWRELAAKLRHRRPKKDFRVRGNVLHMNGDIDKSTPAKLQQALDDNPDLRAVLLECVPGSMEDITNLEAAELVCVRHLDTHVPNWGIRSRRAAPTSSSLV